MGSLSGIFLIVRRSLRQHALSTTVTVLSLALGMGLVMAIFSVQRQAQEAFYPDDMGFDAVLGSRGSKLQLVLNTVYHLEKSPGNIPWSMYQEIASRRDVDFAIPYAVGDNYQGFRIVGTTGEIFTRFEYREGRKLELAGGEYFDPERRSAVIGYTVARETGLKIGAVFQPNHGVYATGPMQDHDVDYVVSGILKPTSTPSDRVIWIPIEGVFRMEGHELRGSGERYKPSAGEMIPDEHKEVSSVMLRFKRSSDTGRANFAALKRLEHEINREGRVATFAYPIAPIMKEIFDKMGWIVLLLECVAYLVVAVAASSILASIYNTMNERRREFAILRALGARRATVFSAIILESAAIAALGAAVGFGVYFAIVVAAKNAVHEMTGVVWDVMAGHEILWQAPLGMVLLGVLSGILPAWKAYSTDVAANLSPTS